jgi:hypothetical protein
MSFASSIVKSYAGGALTAFAAPLASYKGSQIPLNGITATSTTSTAGLALQVGGVNNIEFDSLSALVETDLTTNTITATTKWQVSNDGTNWVDLLGKNLAANATKSAAGTGGLVTTQYVQVCDGFDYSWPYIRLAVLVGVVTGAAGDNVTVAYNWRKRFVAPIG